MLLIGIAGQARSGKDTVANHLVSEYGFMRMAFADPLKAACTVLFDLSCEESSEENKEERITYWGVSPRTMYQLTGDALKQAFGPKFWVQRWAKEYGDFSNVQDVVVSDVRFEQEAEMIRYLGGVVIHIQRPGAGLTGVEAQHNSERGIAFIDGDIMLNNSGTLDDLIRKIDNIMDDI